MSGAAHEAVILRSDAARNRDALIDAARAVFAARGLDAPLDDIARLAGTGNATLYRHFPSRCSLVAAVFTATLVDVVAACRRALADPDPWEGFASHVAYLCELQADDRGLADLLTMSVTGVAELERLRRLAYDGLVELVRRAQADGSLRPDFDPVDVPAFLMANAGLVHRTIDDAPTAWRRVLRCFLDGLRTGGGGGAPLPPAPTRRAIRAAMAGRSAHLGCS